MRIRQGWGGVRTHARTRHKWVLVYAVRRRTIYVMRHLQAQLKQISGTIGMGGGGYALGVGLVIFRYLPSPNRNTKTKAICTTVR